MQPRCEAPLVRDASNCSSNLARYQWVQTLPAPVSHRLARHRRYRLTAYQSGETSSLARPEVFCRSDHRPFRPSRPDRSEGEGVLHFMATWPAKASVALIRSRRALLMSIAAALIDRFRFTPTRHSGNRDFVRSPMRTAGGAASFLIAFATMVRARTARAIPKPAAANQYHEAAQLDRFCSGQSA